MQKQRRAIEALKEFVTSPWLPEAFEKRDVTFKMGKNERRRGWHETLVYLGLSQGFGTCSDIHGMDVAVFNPMPCSSWQIEQRKKGKDWAWAQEPDWKRFPACAYAVLLWPDGHFPIRIKKTLHAGRVGHEINRIDLQSLPDNQSTVELLQFSSYERPPSCGTFIYLERTGLIASYVEL